MGLKYPENMDWTRKKVVARFDFNVPLEEGRIVDTTRIDLGLETIRYLLDQGAQKLTLISHLGRPQGRPGPRYSLAPVATYLAQKLSQDVVLTESCLDGGIKALLALPGTKIVLLENVRFHPEEEACDHEFARALAYYGDIFVNDSFGACHRKHASTYGINAFFKGKACGGFLLKREIEALNKITQRPAHPFLAIVGGAKVGDKIKVIEALLARVDGLLVGGAMAYPFLKAQGHSVGASPCHKEDVAQAKRVLAGPGGERVHLPRDHVVAPDPKGHPQVVAGRDIKGALMGLDVGPKTLAYYESLLQRAKTVLWNGPMGLFETQSFAEGTHRMAKVLAGLDAFTFVGGGDSVRAVEEASLSGAMDHVSTGGGPPWNLSRREPSRALRPSGLARRKDEDIPHRGKLEDEPIPGGHRGLLCRGPGMG